jgi:hypothetical protein
MLLFAMAGGARSEGVDQVKSYLALDRFLKPGISIGGTHNATACTNNKIRLRILNISSPVDLNTESLMRPQERH